MNNLPIKSVKLLESETGADTILFTLDLPSAQYGEKHPVVKLTASHKTGLTWLKANFPDQPVKIIHI